MRQQLLVLAVAWVIAPTVGTACLWDVDSLEMERQRFPAAHELIVGSFVRHSDAYYEWRIANRTAKPNEDRTPLDFDDIAVAYDKLGRHEEAIDTIRDKVARWPDERRYESEANLGTFCIHADQLEAGLLHINNAIRINPDAHFGREIYQKLLVEYLMHARQSGANLPLHAGHAFGDAGFAAFVFAARGTTIAGRHAEIQSATKGVLGMMRFGNHGSPVLLETLGDLLLAGKQDDDAKMLAARAYLKASYGVADEAAASTYREKAASALASQFERDIAEVESELKREIAQADELFRDIADNERTWIAAGDNVDSKFARLFYEAPPLDLDRPDWRPINPVTKVLLAGFGGLVVIVTALVLTGRFLWRKSQQRSEQAAQWGLKSLRSPRQG